MPVQLKLISPCLSRSQKKLPKIHRPTHRSRKRESTSRSKGYVTVIPRSAHPRRAARDFFPFSPGNTSATSALTFPGVRDLLGSALLRGQELLDTLRLAGHLCEWRTANSVTNRSYDFGASALCPALNDGAPFRGLVLAHVAPSFRITRLLQVSGFSPENNRRNYSYKRILIVPFKSLCNKFKISRDNEDCAIRFLEFVI